MSTNAFVILSAILFSIGAVGVLTRRNAIVAFMSVEMMLNAANLAFVAYAHSNGDLTGQVVAFFVMVVAAAAGVGRRTAKAAATATTWPSALVAVVA